MFVDWRGVAVVLGILLGIVLLCTVDISCSGGGEPDVLKRVKGEMASGRKEFSILRRDELAEQLRTLRALNRQLVERGEKARSRELTLLIIDLEKQYERANAQAEGR